MAVGVIVMSAGCDQQYPGLHVAGNQLVDRHGRQIRLLGVNRSGAEYACLRGHPPLAGPAGRRAIAAMKAWRINAVRVPLNEHCWLGINGAPAGYSRAHYRAAIRHYVARLHRARLYVGEIEPANGPRRLQRKDILHCTINVKGKFAVQ